MKRFFDITVSFVGIVLTFPILLFCAFLIKITSAGPAIFPQSRVGRHQSLFTLYKLRTMVTGTKEAGTHEVGRAAVTGVGRFLRRTKMDELPQLWNVIIGDMSLVGPRPCLPTQHELIEEREKRGVYLIRPGITGLAQINGIDMSEPVRLAQRDAEYVTSKHLIQDISILLNTVLGRGGGDNVAKDLDLENSAIENE